MARPLPKCFCERKAAPGECPNCTKVDWTKLRGSNGAAALDKCVSAKFGGDR